MLFIYSSDILCAKHQNLGEMKIIQPFFKMVQNLIPALLTVYNYDYFQFSWWLLMSKRDLYLWVGKRMLHQKVVLCWLTCVPSKSFLNPSVYSKEIIEMGVFKLFDGKKNWPPSVTLTFDKFLHMTQLVYICATLL